MIDEHGVELACLHALGLLDQTDATELGDAAGPGSPLENLVRDLSEAAAALALAASTPPPPALRSRVLAAIGSRPEGRENL
jgi:hypothetical protein